MFRSLRRSIQTASLFVLAWGAMACEASSSPETSVDHLDEDGEMEQSLVTTPQATVVPVPKENAANPDSLFLAHVNLIETNSSHQIVGRHPGGSGLYSGGGVITAAHVVESLYQIATARSATAPGRFFHFEVRFPSFSYERTEMAYEAITPRREGCLRWTPREGVEYFSDDIAFIRLEREADIQEDIDWIINGRQQGQVNHITPINLSNPLATSLTWVPANVYGRVNNSDLSTDSMFTRPVSIRKSACPSGGTCLLAGQTVSQPGDSGGPVWRPGGWVGITAGRHYSTLQSNPIVNMMGCLSSQHLRVENRVVTYFTPFYTNAGFLQTAFQRSAYTPDNDAWWSRLREADPANQNLTHYDLNSLANHFYSENVCSGVTCSDHGLCNPLGTTPSCHCDAGYQQRRGDPTQCDVEVSCAATHCGNNSTCRIRNGSPTCIPDTDPLCNLTCPQNSRCVPFSNGSIQCACSAGYALSSGSCVALPHPMCNPGPDAIPSSTAYLQSSGDEKVTVIFRSGCSADDTIVINWVDPTGVEKEYGRIWGSDSFFQETFKTHVWRVRNAKTNNLIGEYVINDSLPKMASGKYSIKIP